MAFPTLHFHILEDSKVKTANTFHTVVAVGLSCLPWISPGSTVQAEDKAGLAQSQVDQPAVLRNDQLGLVFDRKTGTLTAIENRLTGETYRVQGDQFEVEAVQFHTNFAACQAHRLGRRRKDADGRLQRGDLSIQMRYILRGHFVEKQMTLTSLRDYGLKKLILSRPRFSGTGLEIVAHRYPTYGRKPGEEPCCTFFGRTPKGGFFLGAEVPFDASSLTGTQAVLAYSPSLKVKAHEQLKSEPAYFGVYRRRSDEKEPSEHPPAIRVGRHGGDDLRDPRSAAIRIGSHGLRLALRDGNGRVHGAVRGGGHEIARFPGGMRDRLAFATAIPGAERRKR